LRRCQINKENIELNNIRLNTLDEELPRNVLTRTNVDQGHFLL